jgi:hypothetical protein
MRISMVIPSRARLKLTTSSPGINFKITRLKLGLLKHRVARSLEAKNELAAHAFKLV